MCSAIKKKKRPFILVMEVRQRIKVRKKGFLENPETNSKAISELDG